MANEDVFYVNLTDPVEIRRSLLESSKQTVKLLQRYELIRDIRVKKVEEMNRLKKNFKELTVLINKLKQELPKTNVRIKTKTILNEVPTSGSDLDNLHEELRMIETKLNKLG